ncbi:exonuclease domain-containing protein [uncultured Paraglaciecola sp.]|uniref:exonuclease domain-containing protein n=1 Tax=uncultured Paraglaciecola sp. TaxID=1765024 RepID=UPI0030D741F7
MLVLPEKYYLDHFNEFIAHTEQHSAELLRPEHVNFIHMFKQLEHNAQCMLVRVINRRSEFITCSKLIYGEIAHCQQQIIQLTDQGLLRNVAEWDVPELLHTLNKIQLIELLLAQSIPFKKSAPKAVLLNLVNVLEPKSVLQHPFFADIKVKTFVQQWQYLLFLFFGNLNSALDKFSMRDLGVLKTRNKDKQQGPRFSQLQEAQSAFFFASASAKLAHMNQQALLTLSHDTRILQPPHGSLANEYAANLLYSLGVALFSLDHSRALALWKMSAHQKAQERWIRETYKINKDTAKTALEDILRDPQDDELSLFAFDFYQRKFNQVKLSVRTQRLRDNSRKVFVDEIYKERVEVGVKHHYEAQNEIVEPSNTASMHDKSTHSVAVFRTENRLFRALFGLTFWSLLFNEAERATGSEFDRRPRLVRENRLYIELGEQVETQLALFTQKTNGQSDCQEAVRYLTSIATRYYGQPNGIFRWNSNMLEVLRTFLQHANGEHVANHLRAMAQNYQGLKDGYPDLMIIEHKHLRFEEVKAPGDQLRANQLVSIDALQNAGFDVGVCQVEWRYNPKQSYVVIDVETTGGCKPGHRMTEIGAVKIVDGQVVDSWTSLINPERRIPHFITRLTGISNDMVRDAPLFCEVVDELERFMQNSIFVAHNVNFDYGFFKLEYERLSRTFSMPKLCTVREMRKYYPGSTSYSLGKLTKEYGLSLDNHHRALCDAQAAAELLIMVNEKKQGA